MECKQSHPVQDVQGEQTLFLCFSKSFRRFFIKPSSLLFIRLGEWSYAKVKKLCVCVCVCVRRDFYQINLSFETKASRKKRFSFLITLSSLPFWCKWRTVIFVDTHHTHPHPHIHRKFLVFSHHFLEFLDSLFFQQDETGKVTFLFVRKLLTNIVLPLAECNWSFWSRLFMI